MSRQPQTAVQADFQRVLEFLRDRKIVPDDASASMLDHAKSIHSKTYCLILWKFRLIDLPLRGQAFLDEIASDAIQILPQMMMGYNKSTKLLIRGIIENTLRHIYFTDHPVEFIRLNQDKKWYLNSEALFDYARSHHYFKQTEPRFDALARLSSTYEQLSAGVHGRTVFDLEMKTALESFKYDQERASKDLDCLSACASAVIFLLAIFHRDKFNEFDLAERRTLLRKIPSEARRVISNFEEDS